MNGQATQLVKFIEGNNDRFVIPVYQRNYDWKEENCKQLYNDLVTVAKEGLQNHFFGSIVSLNNPDGAYHEYQIIDGQQRLTTVSLLLLALHKLLDKKLIPATNDRLSERIINTYLTDPYESAEARIKLQLVKTDREAFAKLFDSDEPDTKSKLTINFEYFFKRILKQEISAEQLHDAICRLQIISITLNRDDNPQLIFESLNSTGLALSEGDKIRNFVLMGLPTTKQTRFHDKYWTHIERYTNNSVSAFIRDYLSIKTQTITKFDKVYFQFKAYVRKNELTTEELLEDLLAYAKYYNTLLHGSDKMPLLTPCIDRLNRLDITVTRPFLLEVLRLFEENKLSQNEVNEIFMITESYIFRRTICDLSTNALNKTFLSMHREIMQYDNTENNYLEKFKYTINDKKDKNRFPSNEEFFVAFTAREVYKMNYKNKAYIFERFENGGTREDKDIYRHLDDGSYTIEHIMPQQLTPSWRNSLGEDFEAIHEKWLHKMANLTLTAYNSRYSNASFSDKCNMLNGFKQSGIRLNAFVAQKEQWTSQELEERQVLLMTRALTIWPRPRTEFRPTAKQFDSFTLDDEVSVSNRSVLKYQFKGIEQNVNLWVDLLEGVLRLLHSEDKSVLQQLAASPLGNGQLSTVVSTSPKGLRSPLEIDTNIFIEKNNCTERKLDVLRNFFKLYKEEPSELVIFLRDNSDNSDNTEE